MNLDLEAYVHLNSPLHRWEPRYKLMGLFTLCFAFALVEDLRLLPAMVGVTALLYGVSQLPLSFLLSRICYPGWFILGVVLLLPLLSGDTVIWQWGALALRQEGSMAAILIVCRFFSIFTLGLVLLATSPFLITVKAMRSLGLPAILADMMLLTYRYLQDLGATLITMKRAMNLRGFQRRHRQLSLVPAIQRDLGLFASLIGTLLVRSYEQSERIYKAMCLRGYRRSRAWGRSPSPAFPRQRGGSSPAWSLGALGFVILISAAFVTLDVLLT